MSMVSKSREVAIVEASLLLPGEEREITSRLSTSMGKHVNNIRKRR